MITIQLPSGERATVTGGVWSVEDNAEITQFLNAPSMRPPANGYYAPTEDARCAMHVLNVIGGTWVTSDEHYAPGKLY